MALRPLLFIGSPRLLLAHRSPLTARRCPVKYGDSDLINLHRPSALANSLSHVCPSNSHSHSHILIDIPLLYYLPIPSSAFQLTPTVACSFRKEKKRKKKEKKRKRRRRRRRRGRRRGRKKKKGKIKSILSAYPAVIHMLRHIDPPVAVAGSVSTGAIQPISHHLFSSLLVGCAISGHLRPDPRLSPTQGGCRPPHPASSLW